MAWSSYNLFMSSLYHGWELLTIFRLPYADDPESDNQLYDEKLYEQGCDNPVYSHRKALSSQYIYQNQAADGQDVTNEHTGHFQQSNRHYTHDRPGYCQSQPPQKTSNNNSTNSASSSEQSNHSYQTLERNSQSQLPQKAPSSDYNTKPFKQTSYVQQTNEHHSPSSSEHSASYSKKVGLPYQKHGYADYFQPRPPATASPDTIGGIIDPLLPDTSQPSSNNRRVRCRGLPFEPSESLKHEAYERSFDLSQQRQNALQGYSKVQNVFIDQQSDVNQYHTPQARNAFFDRIDTNEVTSSYPESGSLYQQTRFSGLQYSQGTRVTTPQYPPQEFMSPMNMQDGQYSVQQPNSQNQTGETAGLLTPIPYVPGQAKRKRNSTDSANENGKRTRGPPRCVRCYEMKVRCKFDHDSSRCTACIESGFQCASREPIRSRRQEPEPKLRCEGCYLGHHKCMIEPGRQACNMCIQRMVKCVPRSSKTPRGSFCQECRDNRRSCLYLDGSSTCVYCDNHGLICSRAVSSKKSSLASNASLESQPRDNQEEQGQGSPRA